MGWVKNFHVCAAIPLSRKFLCCTNILGLTIAPVCVVSSITICARISKFWHSHAHVLPSALRRRLDEGLTKVHYSMRAQFSCYHTSSQPTYRELFQYASDQPDAKFKGSVVVLANGLGCNLIIIKTAKTMRPDVCTQKLHDTCTIYDYVQRME